MVAWCLLALLAPPEVPVLQILGSPALTHPLTEAAKKFSEEKNCDVNFLPLNSERAKRAVMSGAARAHVVVLRNLRHMWELVRAGKVEGDFCVLCLSKWVVAVPLSNPAGISKFEDIAKVGVKVGVASKALPKSLPAVHETPLDIARAAGIVEGLTKNVAAEFDCVEKLISAVAEGKVDAAIVEKWAVHLPEVEGKVKAIPIPLRYLFSSPLYLENAVFAVSVVKGLEEQTLAHEFVRFLLSKQFQETLARWGFVPAIALQKDHELKAPAKL